MDNLFDNLKDLVFKTVANTFGYTATWQGQTAKVVFTELTEDEKLGGVNYSPNKPKIEYNLNSFVGLKEAVDGGSNSELLTIKGRNYLVRKVDLIIDGDCFIAELYAK